VAKEIRFALAAFVKIIVFIVLLYCVLVFIVTILQTIWTLSVGSAITFFIQFVFTVFRDAEELTDFHYWLKMGIVSIIGAIPVTVGFLSNAFGDLILGGFLSALVWIFGYLIISGMMDDLQNRF
jgi:hypothetical protein